MNFDINVLKNLHNKEKVLKIIRSALEAADPAIAVERIVNLERNALHVGQDYYDLNDVNNIYVIGIGKAVYSMTEGLHNVLGKNLKGGVIIPKHFPEINNLPESIQITTGSHPIPGETSISSTLKLVKFMEGIQDKDILFCLISGGGSALMSLPVKGVGLNDIQELTRQLLACGADIGEINSLRKHLDQVKGGGLAKLFHGRNMISLILSDVIDSPLDVIASGPTVADTSSFRDGLEILEKYKIIDHIPASIFDVLENGSKGKIGETVKEDNPCLKRVKNMIIGNNYISAMTAMESAKQEGFNSMFLTAYLQGEARQTGMLMGSILRQVAITNQPLSRPACLVAGGETTVTIKGTGLGGRNMELALGAVKVLNGIKNVALITLATDGEDGPTDAAGAIVSGETNSIGFEKNLNPEDYLRNNDSYHYFEKMGSLIKTGPTGTNVNDLVFLFAF